MSSDEDRDTHSSDEEEVDQRLSNSDVVVKYHTAAQIANKVVAKIVSECTPGKKAVELCALGDKMIEEEVKNVFKSAKLEKGIAFPTCVSPNNIAGHLSPLSDDQTTLADGDLVKIDLGVHIDGFIATLAHTHVVGSNAQTPVTGKKADAICAAHIAGQCALRLLKPGKKNSEVSQVIKKVAEVFHVNPVEGVLSHQMKRFVIDGSKVIINKPTADQQVEEFTFAQDEVYSVDIVMSTGEGKPKEFEARTTVYKRAVDQNYSLKLAAARKVFSEVNSRFPALPFTMRWIEDKHAKFGMTELVNHGLVHTYPVLYEKDGEFIAQFKYTALVGPDGAERVTEHPLPYVQSQYAVEDAELKALLAQSAKMKKKKKKTKKKKKESSATPASDEATPMETN
jgi:curved DNA binding protein